MNECDQQQDPNKMAKVGKSILVLAAIVSIPFGGPNWMARCIRAKLFPEDEPSSEQMHKTYRIVATDQDYRALNFSGIDSDLYKDPSIKPNGVFLSSKIRYCKSRKDHSDTL